MNADDINPMNEPWREIGLAICKALNIDESDVTGLTLTINVGEVPQLIVRRRVVNNDSQNLAAEFTQMTDRYRIEAS